MFDQSRIPKEGNWQIDRDFDVTVPSSEIARNTANCSNSINSGLMS
jgi:hypothetical protein